ncbi:hypothetical protein [Gordonia sp. CPCC 205333]|uniref:hypothetical protein n=1 Tax=Gordonia sp. CPCC 205333 TaxID=3140790 RepID=UPI003AF3FDBC
MRRDRAALPVQQHMIATYFTLRILITTGALSVPIGCLLWTAVDSRVALAGSLSAFYHTPARNLVVGAVVAVGVCLIAYRGYSPGENRLLNGAGIAGIGLAVFPTAAPGHGQDNVVNWIHIGSAIGFFALVSATIVVYSWRTLPLLSPRTAKVYRGTYLVLCLCLIGFPVGAAAVAASIGPGTRLLGLETGAIVAFAAYWAVKTDELRRSSAEGRIVAGTVTVADDGRCEVNVPVIQRKYRAGETPV